MKGLLLAVSLRKHWPATIDLVACVPANSEFRRLSTTAARTLDVLGVRLASVFNPIGADYPIANKMLCLDVQTDANRIIFLDSDILALANTSEQELGAIFGTGFVAKAADVASFNGDRFMWQYIYRTCASTMPNFEVVATTSGEFMPPYFNAGVIAVDAKSGFSQLWSDCAKRIDKMRDIPSRRPHLDQIALPVAAAKSAAPINLLDENWNFPAHLRPVPPIVPKLCHYHWPEVIEREPTLLDAVDDLVAGSAGLAETLGHHEKWRRLSRKVQRGSKIPRAVTLPDGVITGIPRSGTSYLCQLLHALPDQVVINEPKEIFGELRGDIPGHSVARYYRDLRRRILDGEAIENKTEGGAIIADTAKSDIRTSAPIAVEKSDFSLWTKNTLAYLNRLPQLLEAMPEATFIACVRHPLETVESWARTFPHLRDADVEHFPVGHPSDRWLTQTQREDLSGIAACDTVPRRRAMLWNYLASIILELSDRLVIVRLEDFAENPASMLNDLVTGRSHRGLAISPIRIGSRKNAAADTLEHVANECNANAAQLGYVMRS